MAATSQKKNVTKMFKKVRTWLVDSDNKCSSFVGQTSEYIHD